MTKEHWSDCALHNAPALPIGECDCDNLDLAEDLSHGAISPPVFGTGSSGLLIEERKPSSFIEPQEFPADGLIMDASAA